MSVFNNFLNQRQHTSPSHSTFMHSFSASCLAAGRLYSFLFLKWQNKFPMFIHSNMVYLKLGKKKQNTSSAVMFFILECCHLLLSVYIIPLGSLWVFVPQLPFNTPPVRKMPFKEVTLWLKSIPKKCSLVTQNETVLCF